jgi:hypothetical protein
MNSYLVDFHHGWLIEIAPSEQGFQAICYSPCRQQLIVDRHSSDLDALYAAKQQIDYQLACHSLSCIVRELYETGRLHSKEWQMLQQSLTCTSRGDNA